MFFEEGKNGAGIIAVLKVIFRLFETRGHDIISSMVFQ